MNSSRLIPSTFSFSGNDTVENMIPIGTGAAFNLIAITEYHVGSYKFNMRLFNQDWFFVGVNASGQMTQVTVNNAAIFTVDPTNSLTEAKLVFPKPILIASGSGLDVKMTDTSGSSNTVILTFQFERAA